MTKETPAATTRITTLGLFPRPRSPIPASTSAAPRAAASLTPRYRFLAPFAFVPPRFWLCRLVSLLFPGSGHWQCQPAWFSKDGLGAPAPARTLLCTSQVLCQGPHSVRSSQLPWPPGPSATGGNLSPPLSIAQPRAG